MTTIGTTTAAAITPGLVFLEEGVSFAGSIVDDEEGIGDAEALAICGVDAGEARALLDVVIGPDSADTSGDTDDDVVFEPSPHPSSMFRTIVDSWNSAQAAIDE
jgi:hypothetical protein